MKYRYVYIHIRFYHFFGMLIVRWNIQKIIYVLWNIRSLWGISRSSPNRKWSRIYNMGTMCSIHVLVMHKPQKQNNDKQQEYFWFLLWLHNCDTFYHDFVVKATKKDDDILLCFLNWQLSVIYLTIYLRHAQKCSICLFVCFTFFKYHMSIVLRHRDTVLSLLCIRMQNYNFL